MPTGPLAGVKGSLSPQRTSRGPEVRGIRDSGRGPWEEGRQKERVMNNLAKLLGSLLCNRCVA